MKRHPALHPLSHHHHHALAAAKRLKMAGIQHKGYRLEEVRDLLAAFWHSGGQAHFREEEEVLLPAYAQYASPDHPEIVRMLLEHVQIRSLVDQILYRGNVTEETMSQLGYLLENHVRREERIIFPLMEQAIPEERLQELAPCFHMNFSPDSSLISVSPDRAE